MYQLPPDCQRKKDKIKPYSLGICIWIMKLYRKLQCDTRKVFIFGERMGVVMGRCMGDFIGGRKGLSFDNKGGCSTYNSTLSCTLALCHC